MIKAGVMVERVEDKILAHIRPYALVQDYPPQGSLCIVVSNPKEIDLSEQRLSWGNDGYVALAKAIDVMCEGRLYRKCDLKAFKEL